MSEEEVYTPDIVFGTLTIGVLKPSQKAEDGTYSLTWKGEMQRLIPNNQVQFGTVTPIEVVKNIILDEYLQLVIQYTSSNYE